MLPPPLAAKVIHMEYTQLSQTDLHVSRIAFGTWAFGGDWGSFDAE
jgi:aryl-alcohol dehydrogenase-like predicted oxidoreductase